MGKALQVTKLSVRVPEIFHALSKLVRNCPPFEELQGNLENGVLLKNCDGEVKVLFPGDRYDD